MLLFSCVHMRNWESTIKLQPHPPRLLGHIPSQWQASFQLLSIVLTGLPNLHRGTMKKKERKKERKRQEVLWPETHAKIATVNIHTKKVALSESAKVDQIPSLAFSSF